MSKRLSGADPPWTEDPILSRYRFTNVYRASDRVSQYLIRNVQYGGDQSPTEVFFRTILFKLFNRISTWELFLRAFVNVSTKQYRFEQFDEVLTAALDNDIRIYSAAYIMPTGSRACRSQRKHRVHLDLVERMIRDGLPHRLAECRSMNQAFVLLKQYPMMGDFLAYQYVTDLNYSTLTDFSEMDFVVPGPGARAGIRKCFSQLGDFSEADVIRWVADRQEHEFRNRQLPFKSLWGRPLQLIDCQNLFCEIDKYSRVAHPSVSVGGRTRIKQRYKYDPEPIGYWFPPKWGLNGPFKSLL